MKILLQIGFLLAFISQPSEYKFDRKLTYEVTSFKKNKTRLITYFINDQDNSYNAFRYNALRTKSEITFVDQGGVYWKGKINNIDLNKSKVTLRKENKSQYNNPFKYQVDNYAFIELTDTILDQKVYKRFMLKSTKPDIEKRKLLGTEIYVIDTSSNVKPLLTFVTAYEIWKKRKSIPNGIIVEKYFFNSNNEMITKEKLISSENIDLILEI